MVKGSSGEEIRRHSATRFDGNALLRFPPSVHRGDANDNAAWRQIAVSSMMITFMHAPSSPNSSRQPCMIACT
jgi:hypothetical protein